MKTDTTEIFAKKIENVNKCQYILLCSIKGYEFFLKVYFKKIFHYTIFLSNSKLMQCSIHAKNEIY